MNILLICSAGMSTSLLVKKMQDSAKAKGIDATIWAVGDAETSEESKKADIILLGPQVKFLLEKTKGIVENKVPVAVINTLTYGTMNGEKALEFALSEYEKFKTGEI